MSLARRSQAGVTLIESQRHGAGCELFLVEGESAAGALLARMPAQAEPIRALAYRLYTLCERKGWAEEARAYNELVVAWSGIEQAASDAGPLHSQASFDI